MISRASAPSLFPILIIILVVAFPAPTALLSQTTPSSTFPLTGLLPKQETGTRQLLADHPENDGRGVVVAVFDSGIDPGAEGLQKTSHGKPKIIDFIDATGSGDVDTSVAAEVADGTVTGLSGRQLSLPPDWKELLDPDQPTVQLGLKAAWDLFPSSLVSRLKEERREAFAREQETLRAETARDESLDPEEREARLKALDAAMTDFRDPGPVFDCIVLRDRSTQQWRAFVDTDEDGDLADERALTNYGIEPRYATFGEDAQLNFTVRIHPHGRRLTIVVPANMHGTHVAGIIGAHYPESPELDGLAPGVQILSVKIGDTRLNGMETCSAVIQGLRAVESYGCQMINMSYGEPTRLPNQGRIVEAITRLVHEKDVIFVASAGNAGPALTTVGAPGATTSAVIGVGAFVTPAMMRAGYALRQTHPDLAYTWSSRGPAADGALGVSICAPGGALSPVPQYTLQRNRYANGTSMSSPNACGSIAVLLGALKREALPYSAASLKRLIENTAQAVPGADVFSAGHGFLRVDRALEAFRQHQTIAEEPRYEIRLPTERKGRGLYLRQNREELSSRAISVTVTPRFTDTFPNESKLKFNRRLRLRSTVPWLEVPEFLFLTHRPSRFDMDLDPKAIPSRASGLHSGEIQALDIADPEAGPIFRVPATLLLASSPAGFPLPPEPHEEAGSLEPGEIARTFLTPPEHTSWAEVTFIHRSHQARQAILHPMQILAQRRHPETGSRYRLDLSPLETVQRKITIVPGQLLEIATAANWSNQGPLAYTLQVRFGGASPSHPVQILSPGQPVARVDLQGSHDDTAIQPSARLTHWHAEISPEASEILPIEEPWAPSPTGPQLYEARVRYGFGLDEATSVLPRFPSFNQRLYEADLQSQLFTVTDANGMILAQDDGWDPDAVSLKKGAFQLHYHWRHPDPALLGRLAQQPMTLEGPLKSPLTLGVHATRREAIAGENPLRASTLDRREILPLHLSTLALEEFPSPALGAQTFIGHLKLHPEDPQSAVRLVHTTTTRSPPLNHEEKAPLKNLQTLREEALQTLLQREEFDTFDQTLQSYREDYPEALMGDVLALHRSDTVERRRHHHEELVALCDTILGKIDQAALARHRGKRLLESDRDLARRFDREFTIFTDALYRKCRAIAYHDGQHEKRGEPFSPEPFEQAFQELRTWVDTEKPEFVLAHIRWHRRHGRFGQALNLLNRHMSEVAPTRLLHRKRVTILGSLGWELWEAHETQWNRRRFAPQQEPDEGPAP